MFQIKPDGEGRLQLIGRFDAVQAEKAIPAFAALEGKVVLDCKELKYASSGGLGLLFATQARLGASGGGLKLINLSPHMRELFTIAGFDRVIDIE